MVNQSYSTSKRWQITVSLLAIGQGHPPFTDGLCEDLQLSACRRASAVVQAIEIHPRRPFYPFVGEGSLPRWTTEKGTLILTSLLEDLDIVAQISSMVSTS